MAIYKPTYCEPFLSTEDFDAIGDGSPGNPPPLYLYCKIASSNFDVTGYRIRLLGPNNEQQFPPASPPETSLSLDSISFVEDLKLLSPNPDPSNPDTNSGRNGTFLKIPFYVGSGSKASNTVSRNQISSNSDITLYNGNDYKWIITLYQLEKVTGGSGNNRYRIPANVNYYDIILASGVIVGSTPKRIQTMPSDKILADYYIQPVHIEDLASSAASLLVSEKAKSWTCSSVTPAVASRGRIYTYDNTLGHLYPQLATEGSWDTVINRTLWLTTAAGTNNGSANGFQVFKQSNNPDDLSVTQKVVAAPHGAIPWVWTSTPANQSQSFGTQTYWISKNQYDSNNGAFYPFDVVQNYELSNVQTITSSQSVSIQKPQKTVCVTGQLWFMGSEQGLWATTNAGTSWSIVTLGGVSTTGEFVESPMQIDDGYFVLFQGKIYKYIDGAWDAGTSAFSNGATSVGVRPTLVRHPDETYEYWYASNEFSSGSYSRDIEFGVVNANGTIQNFVWETSSGQEKDVLGIAATKDKDSESNWNVAILARRKETINVDYYWSFPVRKPSELENYGSVTLEAPSGATISSSWQLVSFSSVVSSSLSDGPNFFLICDGEIYLVDEDFETLNFLADVNSNIKNYGFTTPNTAQIFSSFNRYTVTWNAQHVATYTTIVEGGAQSPISLLSDFSNSPKLVQLMNGRLRWSNDGGATWSADDTATVTESSILSAFSTITAFSTPSDYAIVATALNMSYITSKVFALTTDTAQISTNYGPVSEQDRIVLNYQSVSTDSSNWEGDTYPPLNNGGSPYNGIFAPSFKTTWYAADKTTNANAETGVFAQVLVYWHRTVDADTWGELVNKIVFVPLDAVGDFQGQNIQLDVDEQNNQGGVINTDLVKFVLEKPIKLYELDETNNSHINDTALILYNNPTNTDKEIVPANTLFLKPLVNLENGNAIKFTGTSAWGIISDKDDTTWSVHSVGFNIWDEKTETGYYDASGAPVASDQFLRSKANDYIPVVGGVTYYFRIPVDPSLDPSNRPALMVNFYTNNYTFIERTQRQNNTYTAPANAAFIRFFIYNSAYYGMTYQNDICINVSQTDLTVSPHNGDYVPYSFASFIQESETPYTINSFFRTSDENPFSGAASPTLTVTLNNTGASTESSTSLNAHDVVCEAAYQQAQFVQWKSYQWTLASSDGTEIYDQTPVCYDNQIRAHFYGLKAKQEYQIILSLETNDNRVITQTYPIKCNLEVATGNTPDWLELMSDCNGYYSDTQNGDTGSNCVVIKIDIDNGNAPTACDVYKYEIWPGSTDGEGVCHLVALNVTPEENYNVAGHRYYKMEDYNVANHRYYKYIVFTSGDEPEDSVAVIQTSWAGWTLTDLIPQSNQIGHYSTYKAKAEGVWKFKYNISAGAQTHNLSKTPYSTLSKYPHFSFGATDYVSGSVTCLLGREVIPFDVAPQQAQYKYDADNHAWAWTTGTPRGGYTEVLPNGQAGFRDLTSNEKINMLEAWKRFCYSGNPKLLKDEKGNAYIVQILNTSSETLTNNYGRPEQISFEWQQIDDAKNFIINSL